MPRVVIPNLGRRADFDNDFMARSLGFVIMISSSVRFVLHLYHSANAALSFPDLGRMADFDNDFMACSSALAIMISFSIRIVLNLYHSANDSATAARCHPNLGRMADFDNDFVACSFNLVTMISSSIRIAMHPYHGANDSANDSANAARCYLPNVIPDSNRMADFDNNFVAHTLFEHLWRKAGEGGLLYDLLQDCLHLT